MHALFEAAKNNTALISNEKTHFWVFEYSLNELELSKHVQRLKNILVGVLKSHSSEKVFDVQFEYLEGALGYTDKKHIRLNVGIFDFVMNEDIVPVCSAVALHELFHVLYTDWRSKYVKLPRNNPRNVLWQFVEDTRVECIGKSNNHSCWEDFSVLMRRVCNESMKSLDITPQDDKLNAVIKIMSKWVRVPQLLTEEELEFEINSKIVVDEIARVVPDYGPLDTRFSTDVVVDALSTLLDDLQQPQKSGDKEQKDEKGTANSETADGTSGGVDEGAKSSESSSDDSRDEVGAEEDNIADSATRQPKQGKALKFNQQQFERDVEQVQKPVKCTGSEKASNIIDVSERPIQEVDQQGKQHWSFNHLVGGCAGPILITCVKNKPPTEGQLQEFKRDYDVVRSGIKAIRSKFLIRHAEVKLDVREQLRGRLDHTKLHKVSYDNHVFKVSDTVKSVGMDIALILDGSGSMSQHRRMEQCRRCGILFGEAFKGIPGLNLYIYSHTTGHGTCEITSLYGDKATNDVRNLSTLYPDNGTYDGFALGYIGSRLMNMDSTSDKYIIYVGDGEPCGGYDYIGETGIKHTAKIVKELMRKGIHILGVDIGDQKQFKQMYPVSVKFGDVNNLVKNMGCVVSALVRTRSTETHIT